MLADDVRAMYSEIIDYRGSFGDPIDHRLWNPYDVIRDPGLDPYVRTGVSVAVLHYLDAAIENSTYEDAVSAEGERARALLSEGMLDHTPAIRAAAEAFFQSEQTFLAALRLVYEQVVLPAVSGAPAAQQGVEPDVE